MCPSPPARAHSQAEAPTAESVARLYDGYSSTYDDVSGGALGDAFGFPEMRAKLLSRASGRVLEVGVGTGLNMAYYDPSRITSYTGVDVSQGMLDKAVVQSKRTSLGNAVAVRFVRADASGSLADAVGGGEKFDTVVDTFSLCVIPDPVSALVAARDVLTEDGQVLLLEHTKSKNRALGWYQVRVIEGLKG